MRERSIDEATLLDVIEAGDVRRSDAGHLFIFKPMADRHDNLVCAAAVEEDHLVVKTVMTNWRLRDQS